MLFRLICAVALLGCISVSLFYRKRARAETGTIKRSSESPMLIAGRLLVGLPLFGIVIIEIIDPELMAWNHMGVPTPLKQLGAVTGLLCIPFTVWIFRSIGSNIRETVLTKTDHRLVTWGPYRWVRHPLYTAGFMLFLSASLMLESTIIPFLIVITILAVSLVVVPKEEANLIKVFGDRYRE